MTKRVLLVEDDEFVRQALVTILGSEDVDVEETSSVHEALKKCEATKFDLLMLDYHVEDEQEGWSVAREIRKDPERYGTPKIIAMSGTVNIDADTPMGYSRDTIDKFLAKPFTPAIIRSYLDYLFSD